MLTLKILRTPRVILSIMSISSILAELTKLQLELCDIVQITTKLTKLQAKLHQKNRGGTIDHSNAEFFSSLDKKVQKRNTV